MFCGFASFHICIFICESFHSNYCTLVCKVLWGSTPAYMTPVVKVYTPSDPTGSPSQSVACKRRHDCLCFRSGSSHFKCSFATDISHQDLWTLTIKNLWVMQGYVQFFSYNLCFMIPCMIIMRIQWKPKKQTCGWQARGETKVTPGTLYWFWKNKTKINKYKQDYHQMLGCAEGRKKIKQNP